MKRRPFRMLLAAFFVTTMSSYSSAGLMLTDADIITTAYTPAQSNPGATEILEYINGSSEQAYKDIVEADIGGLLFKWNQGASDDGTESLASSYDIVDKVNSGKDSAAIGYVGTGDIVNTVIPAWLVVKGGNQGFVVYDLDSVGSFGRQWTGLDKLTFTNAGLLNKKGESQSISNIQVWGGSTEPTDPIDPAAGSVPEPATLAIWSALGVCGVAFRRRKNAKNA